MSENDSVTNIIPKTVEEVERLAAMFAKSGMFKSEARPMTTEQCAVVIFIGLDLGISPVQALRSIPIFRDKACPSADCLVGAAKSKLKAGEFITVLETSTTVCKISAKRAGDGQPTICTYTIEDAQTAGLTQSPMYKRFPEQMLYARCATKTLRRVFPDIGMGLYTPDEVTDGKETWEVTHETPTRRIELQDAEEPKEALGALLSPSQAQEAAEIIEAAEKREVAKTTRKPQTICTECQKQGKSTAISAAQAKKSLDRLSDELCVVCYEKRVALLEPARQETAQEMISATEATIVTFDQPEALRIARIKCADRIKTLPPTDVTVLKALMQNELGIKVDADTFKTISLADIQRVELLIEERFFSSDPFAD